MIGNHLQIPSKSGKQKNTNHNRLRNRFFATEFLKKIQHLPGIVCLQRQTIASKPPSFFICLQAWRSSCTKNSRQRDAIVNHWNLWIHCTKYRSTCIGTYRGSTYLCSGTGSMAFLEGKVDIGKGWERQDKPEWLREVFFSRTMVWVERVLLFCLHAVFFMHVVKHVKWVWGSNDSELLAL